MCPGNRKALDSENNDLFEPTEFRHKFHLRDDDDSPNDHDVNTLLKEQNQNLGREMGKLFITIEEGKVLENNCNFTFERNFFATSNLIGQKEKTSTNRVTGTLMPHFEKECMQLRVYENQIPLMELNLVAIGEKGQEIRIGYQMINVMSIVKEEVHLKGIVPLFYRSMRAVNLKLSIQYYSNQDTVSENNYATFGQ